MHLFRVQSIGCAATSAQETQRHSFLRRTSFSGHSLHFIVIGVIAIDFMIAPKKSTTCQLPHDGGNFVALPNLNCQPFSCISIFWNGQLLYFFLNYHRSFCCFFFFRCGEQYWHATRIFTLHNFMETSSLLGACECLFILHRETSPGNNEPKKLSRKKYNKCSCSFRRMWRVAWHMCVSFSADIWHEIEINDVNYVVKKADNLCNVNRRKNPHVMRPKGSSQCQRSATINKRLRRTQTEPERCVRKTIILRMKFATERQAFN